VSDPIAGKYTLDGPTWRSRLGTWHAASSVDGKRRGALLIDPSHLTPFGSAQRLAQAVVAANSLRLPGLVNVRESPTDGRGSWLITAVPAAPTVEQALRAGLDLPAGVAALVATDTGQTLMKLHEHNLAHGDVGPHTVVFAAIGSAMLAECGWSHALAATTPTAADDSADWVTLLRDLANRQPDEQTRRLLREAAQQAASVGGSAGLQAGIAVIAAGAAQIAGFGDRTALTTFALAVAGPPPAPVPVPRMPPTPPVAPPPSADQATQLGQLVVAHQQRAESAPPAPAVMRFGQGPPPPTWQSATAGHPILQQQPKKKKLWKRVSAFFSVLLTLAIGAAIAWMFWQRTADPLVVNSAIVAPAADPNGKCNVQVDVVGTIVTNGNGGTISYEWLRSDGTTSGLLNQTVLDGTTSTQVHLFWQFSGRGTKKVTATLKVHSPNVTEAKTEFTYSCK
jgi:hypothetical protein